MPLNNQLTECNEQGLKGNRPPGGEDFNPESGVYKSCH